MIGLGGSAVVTCQMATWEGSPIWHGPQTQSSVDVALSQQFYGARVIPWMYCICRTAVSRVVSPGRESSQGIARLPCGRAGLSGLSASCAVFFALHADSFARYYWWLPPLPVLGMMWAVAGGVGRVMPWHLPGL